MSFRCRTLRVNSCDEAHVSFPAGLLTYYWGETEDWNVIDSFQSTWQNDQKMHRFASHPPLLYGRADASTSCTVFIVCWPPPSPSVRAHSVWRRTITRQHRDLAASQIICRFHHQTIHSIVWMISGWNLDTRVTLIGNIIQRAGYEKFDIFLQCIRHGLFDNFTNSFTSVALPRYALFLCTLYCVQWRRKLFTIGGTWVAEGQESGAKLLVGPKAKLRWGPSQKLKRFRCAHAQCKHFVQT